MYTWRPMMARSSCAQYHRVCHQTTRLCWRASWCLCWTKRRACPRRRQQLPLIMLSWKYGCVMMCVVHDAISLQWLLSICYGAAEGPGGVKLRGCIPDFSQYSVKTASWGSSCSGMWKWWMMMIWTTTGYQHKPRNTPSTHKVRVQMVRSYMKHSWCTVKHTQ